MMFNELQTAIQGVKCWNYGGKRAYTKPLIKAYGRYFIMSITLSLFQHYCFNCKRLSFSLLNIQKKVVLNHLNSTG